MCVCSLVTFMKAWTHFQMYRTIPLGYRRTTNPTDRNGNEACFKKGWYMWRKKSYAFLSDNWSVWATAKLCSVYKDVL